MHFIFPSWLANAVWCVSVLWIQLRYGEPTLRRAVPLALALISVSNPRLNILDTLSKFSHDADPEVSHNAIFAMGMVGSGQSLTASSTNNRSLTSLGLYDFRLYVLRVSVWMNGSDAWFRLLHTLKRAWHSRWFQHLLSLNEDINTWTTSPELLWESLHLSKIIIISYIHTEA